MPNNKLDDTLDPETMDEAQYHQYLRKLTVISVNPEIHRQAIPRLRDFRIDMKKLVMPMDKEMTREKLSERYERLKRDWEVSDSHRILVKAFEDTVLKQKKLSITACMCLGLGSMNSGSRRRNQDNCDKSMKQLVCFESWIGLLGKETVKDVYFQDPEFNTLDEEFLLSKGYKVLHTPESDDKMNESMLLFAPGLPEHVFWSLFSTAIPAVVISRRIDNHYLYHWRPDEGGAEGSKPSSGDKDEHLPAWERVNHRELLNSIFEKLVGIDMAVENPRWLAVVCNWLYYRPDSMDSIRPYQAINDDPPETEYTKLYKKPEANAFWLGKGWMSQTRHDFENKKDSQRLI